MFAYVGLPQNLKDLKIRPFGGCVPQFSSSKKPLFAMSQRTYGPSADLWYGVCVSMAANGIPYVPRPWPANLQGKE